MFLAIRFDETTRRELGINRDGTMAEFEQTDLLSREDASAVAAKFGGTIIDEDRAFPNRDDDLCENED